MKILHFILVPSDQQFTVLEDAIAASDNSIGVAAIYANGLKVLLRENITIKEFDRVAREHLAIVKIRYAGKRGPWYEQWSG